MMKLFAVMLLLALTLESAFAQAPAKAAVCVACHGVGGAKPLTPNYPKLNGQNKAYLADSLKAYRSGDRKAGLAAIMAGQAAGLSDADINELAEYYSKQ
jgi:cytochrome c553